MTTLRLNKPSNRQPLPTPTPEKVAKRWLMNDWPELFSTDSPKPLAIGIRMELVKIRPAEVSHKGLRRALARWCSRLDYLSAVARGGPRFGLNGEHGEITPDQQQRGRHASKRQGPRLARPSLVRFPATGPKRDTERDTKRRY